jgi:hypothetical protein
MEVEERKLCVGNGRKLCVGNGRKLCVDNGAKGALEVEERYL